MRSSIFFSGTWLAVGLRTVLKLCFYCVVLVLRGSKVHCATAVLVVPITTTVVFLHWVVLLPGGSGIVAHLVIKLCRVYVQMSKSTGTPWFNYDLPVHNVEKRVVSSIIVDVVAGVPINGTVVQVVFSRFPRAGEQGVHTNVMMVLQSHSSV